MIRNWAAALIRRFGLIGAVVSLLVAFLITLVAIVTVSFLPLSSANRNIAIGDAFAGGIFMLALVAAVVAILAYYQSSRRPKLNTEWSFYDLRDDSVILEGVFPRDSSSRNFTDNLPLGVRDRSDLIPLIPAKLWLDLENSGEVAAKNVAVLLRLEGIYFSPPPRLDPGSPWGFFYHPKGWKVQWEGGSGRSVYRGLVPRSPVVELTGMWAVPDIAHTNYGAVVTLADDLEEPEMKPLKINAAPLPTQ